MTADFWRTSPFRIEGYDPLELDMEMLEGILEQ
jgi:hypothetical protein